MNVLIEYGIMETQGKGAVDGYKNSLKSKFMRHIHRATCSLIENMYNQTTCFYIIQHFAQPNYPRE